MGFPYQFVSWILACVTSVSFAVSVNGEVTESFEARRGLRQGDPMSPYLFVICMEYLHRCLMELRTNRAFHYHPRCKKFNLIHVCFADDLLLFSRGDLESVRQSMIAFQKFAEVSGLKANQAKSCVYFGGVTLSQQDLILQEFGMVKGELPFRYLGVPLSSRKFSVLQCQQPLIKKIISRIDCWSSKLLSYAGRVQLIKSVLFGIQSYWCQVFLIPQKVLKAIQTACRVFLWTGKSGLSKRALVVWDHLCLPEKAGGLNFTNIHWWNKAAICKMFWNVALKKDRVWIQWIHGYYVKQQNLLTMSIPSQTSWVVRKILKARDTLLSIPDGLNILNNAQFSIRKLYCDLRGDSTRVAWHRCLSDNAAPPKCVFILWLALLGRLTTCDHLLKINMVVDPVCCLCMKENDDINHLFFACEFSARVWMSVTTWGSISRPAQAWGDEMVHLITQCGSKTGKQKMYRMLVAIVVYQVWKEQNRRKFQEAATCEEFVIKQCQLIAATRCQLDPKLARFLHS